MPQEQNREKENGLKIKDIFTADPQRFNSLVESYIRTTKDFIPEINAFKTLSSDQNYDRSLFVFYVEILSRALRKSSDISAFVAAVLSHVDSHMSLKSSVLVLRTLKVLGTCRCFIPVTFYLTKLMALAMGMKSPKRTGKGMDYERVKISTEESESEELQTFIIRECIILIKRHCHGLGRSIGFPEVAVVICNELKTQCKNGIYKEITMDLVNYILKRKSYIEERRSKANLRSDDAGAVSVFENSLEVWEI